MNCATSSSRSPTGSPSPPGDTRPAHEGLPRQGGTGRRERLFRVAAAEQHRVHQQREELVQRRRGPASRRRAGAAPGSPPAPGPGGAAEQGEHRQVGLAVAAVRGRVDQPRPARRRPTARCRSTGRRAAGRAVRRGPRAPGSRAQTSLDRARPRPGGRCRRRPRGADTAAPGARRTSPASAAGDVPHRGASDVRVPGPPGGGAPNAGAPQACRAARSRPNRAAAAARRARRHPVDHQPAAVVAVHRRHADRSGLGQPAQSGRLGPPRAGVVTPLDHHHPPVVESDLGERPGQRGVRRSPAGR